MRQQWDFRDIRMLDMDMRLAFQLDQQFSQLGYAALRFQQYTAVRQVADPAGQIQVPRQIQRGVPESHMLNLTGKKDTPARLCRSQLCFSLRLNHMALTSTEDIIAVFSERGVEDTILWAPKSGFLHTVCIL